MRVTAETTPTQTDAMANPSNPEKPAWSIGGRNYVLVLLTAVAAMNFVDRQILGVLLEPIKAEFGLPDWMLGLLTGIGFAAFYGMQINFWLALFNMLPIWQIDGQKVWVWNKAVWALFFVISVLAVFGQQILSRVL